MYFLKSSGVVLHIVVRCMVFWVVAEVLLLVLAQCYSIARLSWVVARVLLCNSGWFSTLLCGC